MLASLHAQLDAGAAHGPEYARGLSNHLPMLLHALYELGAPATRLEQFAAHYACRLLPAPEPTAEPAPEPAPAPSAPWAHLGRFEAWPELLAHFQERVRALGQAGAVREALPVLMPGVSAAAFHGLLRTAHGLAAGHGGEVAQGLAYWAARHQPLGVASAWPPPDLALADWWVALNTWAQGRTAQGALIAGRMRAWAAQPGFAPLALRLCPGDTVLPALAQQAATLYARSGDFTLLHVLTSSWAMRVLAPLQADGAAALRHYAVAVAAGWLASGRGQAMPDVPLLDWTHCIERALASEDDHLAKLVHAARNWHHVTGHVAFQLAAARAAAGNLRG